MDDPRAEAPPLARALSYFCERRRWSPQKLAAAHGFADHRQILGYRSGAVAAPVAKDLTVIGEAVGRGQFLRRPAAPLAKVRQGTGQGRSFCARVVHPGSSMKAEQLSMD